jgi:hypothetical protein
MGNEGCETIIVEVSTFRRPPTWVPKPSRLARRVAAETVALNVIWREAPLPIKLVVMALASRVVGLDGLVKSWLHWIPLADR